MSSAGHVRARGGGSRGTLLTLVRHGETDWNRQRRIQGSTDVPLNAAGIAQASAAAVGLADAGYAAVYSSPQSRALRTAQILANAMRHDVTAAYPGLRERSFGDAEGLSGPEIAARFPDGIPDQESRAAVVSRALPVLIGIAERHPDEAVLVVTHGAVISSLVLHLTEGERPRAGENVTNLSLSHFTYASGVLRLDAFNLESFDPDSLDPGLYVPGSFVDGSSSAEPSRPLLSGPAC